MTTISHRALPVRRCLGGLCVAFVCLVVVSGCATTTYQATDLPPEYVAKANERLDRADLSRLTSISVRSDQIGVGDLLEIAVFSGYGDEQTASSKVNVLADGTANVPPIGSVRVIGMTPGEASRAIEEVARREDVYRTPHVSVRMEEQRTIRVAVSGAVNEPKVVELPQGSSNLLTALVEAGDLAEDASSEVTIRRPALSANTPDVLRGNPLRLADGGNSVVQAGFEEGLPHAALASFEEGLTDAARTIQVNLVSATKEGNGGYILGDGDLVHVKRRPERKIQVGGLVKAPGEFDLPPNNDLYLITALANAGGTSMQLADRVVVLRRVEGAVEPIIITASVRDIRKNRGNIRLQENDVVSVEETPLTVAFDTLRTFFRFSVGSSLALF